MKLKKGWKKQGRDKNIICMHGANVCVCVQVCVCANVYVYVCECVCVSEREREESKSEIKIVRLTHFSLSSHACTH